jgi:hypothetical protein
MSSWKREFKRNENAGNVWWFFLAIVVWLFSVNAGAQQCAANSQVGCKHPGAACSTADIPKGHCKNVEGLPRGERECECDGPPAPPKTAKVNPKYIVAALVYAPPGCTSSTPNTPCSQPGLVDYTSGSSMGSKVTMADSFKDGLKVTVSFGNEITGGGSASFGWDRTTGDSRSTNLTKSASLEVKLPGNSDGINHDQDMFELLLNPTITVRSDGGTNVSWQPGFSGGSPVRYEVYVSELRNPATMRPTVARDLAKAGLTAADFKTIRCLDHFAGPGSSGAGGVRADFCDPAASDGRPAAILDPHRFRPTTWILPYEPPLHAGDLCPSITATLKNEYASEDAKSSQDEYSVGASLQTGAVFLDTKWKMEGSMTWTSGETDTSSQGSSQSAALTLVCPSAGYTGPTIFQVFWDVVFGTFLFVPYDPATMAVMHSGVVVDRNGKPVAGAPVNFAYNGHTFHTFTTSNGSYRFVGLKQLVNPAMLKGTLSVRNIEREVALQAQNPITVRLP